MDQNISGIRHAALCHLRHQGRHHDARCRRHHQFRQPLASPEAAAWTRAIHRAAGRELLAECIELCGCPVGESRLTKGYALPARHVIHTVGPVWLGGASDEVETLRRAVTSALDIARDMKFETVAFCCISRGIHRFPADLAAKTTLEAMLAHDFAGRVTVCAYTDEDLEAYKALLPQ